jgi:hypothetical protein
MLFAYQKPLRVIDQFAPTAWAERQEGAVMAGSDSPPWALHQARLRISVARQNDPSADLEMAQLDSTAGRLSSSAASLFFVRSSFLQPSPRA